MTEQIQPERGPRIKPARPTTVVEKAAISRYIQDSVPDKHKMATERALLKQVPRSVAIKTKCLACCNFDREEVKACAVFTCPLNPYRPYQTSAVDSEDEQNDEV